MTKELNKNILNYIDRYFSLNISGQKVVCPYFINEYIFFGNPVNVGKGTPEEIENEASQILSADNSSDIRKQMIENGLGIDCSGFIYNVFDFATKTYLQKNLSDFLPKLGFFDLRKKVARKVKPQNTISSNEFTSAPFATMLEDAFTVRPGDLIRTKNGKHVLLVYRVETGDNLIKIYFVHSTRFYENNGMHRGFIELNKGQALEQGKWSDESESISPDPTYTGYREIMNKNGIFRTILPVEIFE